MRWAMKAKPRGITIARSGEDMGVIRSRWRQCVCPHLEGTVEGDQLVIRRPALRKPCLLPASRQKHTQD